jgi:hypothetical protein
MLRSNNAPRTVPSPRRSDPTKTRSPGRVPASPSDFDSRKAAPARAFKNAILGFTATCLDGFFSTPTIVQLENQLNDLLADGLNHLHQPGNPTRLSEDLSRLQDFLLKILELPPLPRRQSYLLDEIAALGQRLEAIKDKSDSTESESVWPALERLRSLVDEDDPDFPAISAALTDFQSDCLDPLFQLITDRTERTSLTSDCGSIVKKMALGADLSFDFNLNDRTISNSLQTVVTEIQRLLSPHSILIAPAGSAPADDRATGGLGGRLSRRRRGPSASDTISTVSSESKRSGLDEVDKKSMDSIKKSIDDITTEINGLRTRVYPLLNARAGRRKRQVDTSQEAGQLGDLSSASLDAPIRLPQCDPVRSDEDEPHSVLIGAVESAPAGGFGGRVTRKRKGVSGSDAVSTESSESKRSVLDEVDKKSMNSIKKLIDDITTEINGLRHRGIRF